jgi:hypothetical protein
VRPIADSGDATDSNNSCQTAGGRLCTGITGDAGVPTIALSNPDNPVSGRPVVHSFVFLPEK